MAELGELEQLAELGKLEQLVELGQMVSPDSAMELCPVQLLVFQPTPFCNLNCRYCYLPNRRDSHVMTLETVRNTVRKLDQEKLLSPNFSVIWHAGEPTVVPSAVYADYFATINMTLGSGYTLRHHFQTNGTLLDDSWCDFIREHNVSIGVSIDGPEHIHNRQRMTWAGRGTFRETLRGIEKLRTNGIDFHTISVITRDSVECAPEIFNFLVALKPDFIAFNVEEEEGIHLKGSLRENAADVERFFRTVYRLAKANDFNPPVREFESAFLAISRGNAHETNSQTAAYRIFSVAVDGGFTTFSPELLGMNSLRYGSLNLGNILSDSPTEVARSVKMSNLLDGVQAGVKRCRDKCQYFDLCGGGAPANKLFEKGSFDVDATRFCENSIKVPLRIVLEDLESVVLSRSGALPTV